MRLLQCADGWLAVAARHDRQVAAMCAALGVATPDGADVAASARGTDELLAALDAADVPAERVRLDNKLPFFDDPANRAAGLVASYHHADWGMLEQPGAMWWFGDLATRLELAPPVLGEHTVAVLLDAGLTPAEMDALLESGAVRTAAPRD
jgi:crotonobetainyl-CoA:carnitine CoA-transferase CaiB-like acyl-CoA transferase